MVRCLGTTTNKNGNESVLEIVNDKTREAVEGLREEVEDIALYTTLPPRVKAKLVKAFMALDDTVRETRYGVV